MDEVEEEHLDAKDSIAQLENMQPGEDHYDAKVTVLSEYVDHHIDDEHEPMFPKVKRTKIDTATLGAQMIQLKNELQMDMDIEDSEMRSKYPRSERAKPVHR